LIIENTSSIKGKEIKTRNIRLKDIIQISLWKFPNLPLKKSFPIILGSINSFKLKIICN
jgi:hypothetical protein